MKRVLAFIAVGVGLMLLTFVAYVALFGNLSCYELLLPSTDSAETASGEAADLLQRAQMVHGGYEGGGPQLAFPLRVSNVSGKTATLVVAHEMHDELQYAGAWREVYAAHHGGKFTCVRLRLVWNGGGLVQDYGGLPM